MRLRATLFGERNRRHTLLAAAALFALSFAPPAAHAAETSRTISTVKAEHAGDLKRIQDYLNALTTIVSDFTQVAPDGSLTAGKFFLKRPGKMRWQYEPPTPILMIASGSTLVYYDYELEQVSHIPINSTLAGFLAEPDINLNDPRIIIEQFQKTPGMVRLELAQADKPEGGNIVLEFSDTPLQLRNMVTTDSQGQVTTVSLNNARYGTPLDDKLFVFNDPRKKRVR